MGKITCATCANESKGFCLAKKNNPYVAINKRRRCNKYILDPSKIKEKHIIKTVKMGYREKEALRKEYKERLKQLKSMGIDNNSSVKGNSGDPKHPLTGDLSRFTSTAGDDDA
jgi:hypothetical protein